MRVRFTRRAAAQLDAILSYIDARSPQGAKRVKMRLHAVLNMLAEQPGIGALTTKHGIRRVVAIPYPYLIFYRATETEIIIHGIRHMARRNRD